MLVATRKLGRLLGFKISFIPHITHFLWMMLSFLVKGILRNGTLFKRSFSISVHL